MKDFRRLIKRGAERRHGRARRWEKGVNSREGGRR